MIPKKLKTPQLWLTSFLRRSHVYLFLNPSMRSVQPRGRILLMLYYCEAVVSELRLVDPMSFFYIY